MSKKELLIRLFSGMKEILEYGYSLIECFSILEESNTERKKIKRMAQKIKEKLVEGYELFNAFEACGFSKEITEYKSFFSLAENKNQLMKNLEYVIFCENQKNQVKKCLLLVSIYPLCVVLASLALSYFLISNKKLFFSFVLMENSESVFLERGILQALGFLSFYCGTYLLWVFRSFKGDFGKKVMLAMYFFLQQNFTIQDCLKIMILSEKSEKRLVTLEEILRELKSGKDFFSIVKKNKMFSKVQLSVLEKTKWNKDYKKIFFDYYNLEKRNDKKRVDNIQKYSEVVMIFGVGIFFLILLKKTILPFFTF